MKNKNEFTTACFIKKDTPELRHKLEELGYENRCSEEGIYLRTHYKNTIGQNTFRSRNDIPLEGWDCGTNEELFLAIAALRDDSDINQWFTDGKNWVISDVHTLIELKEYFEKIKFDYSKTHKATVEELIKLFNS